MKLSDLNYQDMSFHHDLTSGILVCTFANINSIFYPFGFDFISAFNTIALLNLISINVCIYHPYVK